MQQAQTRLRAQRCQQRARVVRVQKRRLAADLDAGSQRPRLGGESLSCVGVALLAVDFHHLRLQVLGNELAGAAFGNLAAVVDDDQPVA
jgi:hypothetical protein